MSFVNVILSISHIGTQCSLKLDRNSGRNYDSRLKCVHRKELCLVWQDRYSRQQKSS